MSTRKRFCDLKLGESVYMIFPDSALICEAEVESVLGFGKGSLTINLGMKTIERRFCIVVKARSTRKGEKITTTREEAESILKGKIQAQYKKLEAEIEVLVSEFDSLSRLIESECSKTEIKSKKFRDIKPGMKVWRVNKTDLKVEKVGVCEVGEDHHFTSSPVYRSLEIKTGNGIFSAYPGSDYSFSREYHTSRDRAFESLIKYAKARVKTVGEKMEEKMIKLERWERRLRI